MSSRPRWLEIAAVTAGSVIAAIIVSRDPHRGHSSASTPYTLANSRAQLARRAADTGVSGGSFTGLVIAVGIDTSTGGAGTTALRLPAADANTPKYRV